MYMYNTYMKNIIVYIFVLYFRIYICINTCINFIHGASVKESA